MARRWLSHTEDGRRNSAFTPRPELEQIEDYPKPAPSMAETETMALRKRLSMYARKRASAAWSSPKSLDELPSRASIAPSDSSAWSPASLDRHRSSLLRRTTRNFTAPSLSSEHIPRWIRGVERNEADGSSLPRNRRSTMTISAPYDFQHISHTSAHRLPKLAETDTDSLVSEVLSVSSERKRHGMIDDLPRPLTDYERPTSRARSSSLASIISNQSRTAPTMVHPALRSDNDVATNELASQAWLAPLIHRNSASGSGSSVKNLAVVPEEKEPESPMQSEHAVAPVQTSDNAEAPLPSSADGLASTSSIVRNSAGSADQTTSRDRKSSVPSLSSAAESWEEDIDYCYSVEAESSCNFEWSSLRLQGGPHLRDSSTLGNSARMYAIGSEAGKPAESPRTSIARQQQHRPKPRPESVPDWPSEQVFQKPRKAPETPARTSDEWPLSNTPSLPQSPIVSPSMNSTSLARSPAWSPYVLTSSSGWQKTGTPRSEALTPGMSPIPPPSHALPLLPGQEGETHSPIAVTAWV